MLRKYMLADLPPNHPAAEFVPVMQAVLVLVTAGVCLLTLSIALKEYNFFWVRRRLIEAAEHDRQSRETLKIVHEMVTIALDHRVKAANLLEKVDKKVDEMQTVGPDPSPSSSNGTIPTVKLPEQSGPA